jgi:hypothetical protein
LANTTYRVDNLALSRNTASPTTLQAWRQTHFSSLFNVGTAANTSDADGDSVINLLEFALGTNPVINTGGPAPLQYSGTFAGGGTLTSTGLPIVMVESIPLGMDIRAIFIRRQDAVTAGLTYTPQFSADLSFWQSSATAPTVLADVTPDMPVFNQETFGPVMAIVKAHGAQEAIELADASQYGLAASIWTADMNAGLELGRGIESGALFINGIVVSDPRLPFGGVKLSGYGRELSIEGMHEFTNVRAVWAGEMPRSA